MNKEEVKEGISHLKWLLDSGILASEDEPHIKTVLNYIEKLENMYNKEHNEHIEMKRQNGVLRNNERILREKNKKAKEYVQNLRQYFSEDCQADFVNIIELLGEGD